MRLLTKIGKMYDLAPDNVTICCGSFKKIDARLRAFLKPGDEFMLSSPTFKP